jgi:hypothetical protein
MDTKNCERGVDVLTWVRPNAVRPKYNWEHAQDRAAMRRCSTDLRSKLNAVC